MWRDIHRLVTKHPETAGNTAAIDSGISPNYLRAGSWHDPC